MRAQVKHRHAMARGGKRQLAAQGQIEEFGFAPGFEHQRAEAGAGEAFAGRPQHIFDMGGTEKKNPRRIEPKLQQAAATDFSGFEGHEILPDPQQCFLARSPQGERQRKAGGCRVLAGLAGKHFVQRAAGKPSAKRRIGQGMAQSHAPVMGFLRQQRSPQMVDFPGLGSHGRFHLFLLCSNMLRRRGESIADGRTTPDPHLSCDIDDLPEAAWSIGGHPQTSKSSFVSPNWSSIALNRPGPISFLRSFNVVKRAPW